MDIMSSEKLREHMIKTYKYKGIGCENNNCKNNEENICTVNTKDIVLDLYNIERLCRSSSIKIVDKFLKICCLSTKKDVKCIHSKKYKKIKAFLHRLEIPISKRLGT